MQAPWNAVETDADPLRWLKILAEHDRDSPDPIRAEANPAAWIHKVRVVGSPGLAYGLLPEVETSTSVADVLSRFRGDHKIHAYKPRAQPPGRQPAAPWAGPVFRNDT